MHYMLQYDTDTDPPKRSKTGVSPSKRLSKFHLHAYVARGIILIAFRRLWRRGAVLFSPSLLRLAIDMRSGHSEWFQLT